MSPKLSRQGKRLSYSVRRLSVQGSPSHLTSLSSDYLADSVDAFLTSTTELEEEPQENGDLELDVDSRTVPLGLTFSFPVEQTALDKGYLLTWTKGFSAKNAVNKDIVGLLQDAFDRKHLHVKCVALVNDVCPH